ncbi:MAG: response regulator [Chthoniobacteraceae bacterium]
MDRQTNGGSTAAPATDMQKALLSIRQARDSVLAQNHELISKLAKAEEQLSVTTVEKEGLEVEREVALKRAEKYLVDCDELLRKNHDLEGKLKESAGNTAETAELKGRIAELEAGIADLQRQNAELSAEREQLTQDFQAQSRTLDAQRLTAEEQSRRIAELMAELETKQSSGEEEQLTRSLLEATRRVADLEAQADGFRTQQKKNIIVLTKTLTADREALCQKYNEEIGALKAHVQDLQTQLALAQEAAAESGTSSAAAQALGERLEQQRLENDELAAQLEATRIENRELRAALDENRASAASAATPAPATASQTDEATAYDAGVALGAMMSCIEMLSEHPGGLELIDELESHLRGFGDRAAAAGLRGIHQYTASCGGLTSWLRKAPAKISAETLAPLQEAVTLLSRLIGNRNPAQVFDPAEALVYAVDDDLDNCECIAMALEKVQLRTKYAGRPEVALTEITAAQCDLIILDVDMPKMDGFELAERVRQLPHHARTPIIFLSGLVSTQERLAESGIKDATYMPKPYNLKELGLRVFTRILQSRGNLA